ncbi:MAG TPA: hypothetical protein VL308_11120 [Gemmatimonadaceae bacterium]|jgi:hypothetical protein|nr:hypothetical protein [Gemmatimonadaceae bacterium]
MRLEQVPLFIGVIVAILGLGLVLDAQLPEGFSQSRERRRRERTERSRPGETLMGAGVIAVAAALIGRDEWRFGTLSVLAGVLLLGIGAWLSRDYLREFFVFRGAARRGEKRSEPRGGLEVRTESSDTLPDVVPGLADSPADRNAGLRGDREAPIMTAREPVSSYDEAASDDAPKNSQSRLRIR